MTHPAFETEDWAGLVQLKVVGQYPEDALETVRERSMFSMGFDAAKKLDQLGELKQEVRRLRKHLHDFSLANDELRHQAKHAKHERLDLARKIDYCKHVLLVDGSCPCPCHQ